MSNTPQPAQAPVVLEGKHDGIATLVLNRPERLNALNNELAMALNDALSRIAQDQSVSVVVITGAGRAFCAGGDLGALGNSRQSGTIKEVEPLLRAGMQMVLKMRTMPQPVIAAVNGAAAGAGLNIALAADIRIAAEEATFGQERIFCRSWWGARKPRNFSTPATSLMRKVRSRSGWSTRSFPARDSKRK